MHPYPAYVAAFVMIGSVWLHHHLVFARVRQVDVGALLANLALLLTVSLLPSRQPFCPVHGGRGTAATARSRDAGVGSTISKQVGAERRYRFKDARIPFSDRPVSTGAIGVNEEPSVL